MNYYFDRKPSYISVQNVVKHLTSLKYELIKLVVTVPNLSCIIKQDIKLHTVLFSFV